MYKCLKLIIALGLIALGAKIGITEQNMSLSVSLFVQLAYASAAIIFIDLGNEMASKASNQKIEKRRIRVYRGLKRFL